MIHEWHRGLPLVWIMIVLCLVSSFYYIAIAPVPRYTADIDSAFTSTVPALTNIAPEDRLLVTYAYYETDTARRNLQFFLRHGLTEDADFVFILNGVTDAETLIPAERNNIRVVHRDNICFDLGAHGEVLRKDNLWKQYKRFIVMNASVRGPFLPVWSLDSWTDLFLNRITATNKLVGLTFNCSPIPHVQSMLWATDLAGMELLLDPGHAKDEEGNPRGLGFCYTEMAQAMSGEVRTTGLFQKQGYSVDVLETAFHSSRHFIDECADSDAIDPNFEKTYYGINVHPYEVIFIKANRNINPLALQLFTDWHDAMADDNNEARSDAISQNRTPAHATSSGP